MEPFTSAPFRWKLSVKLEILRMSSRSKRRLKLIAASLVFQHVVIIFSHRKRKNTVHSSTRRYGMLRTLAFQWILMQLQGWLFLKYVYLALKYLSKNFVAICSSTVNHLFFAVAKISRFETSRHHDFAIFEESRR